MREAAIALPRMISQKYAGGNCIMQREYKRPRGQMSESFLTAAVLSVSGGLQDSYTYLFRGRVFANAQTGNIVLLSQHIYERDWPSMVRYLLPLLSFALGVAAAEWIRQLYQNSQKIHWRQLVLLCEILLLFTVGFLPNTLDMMANALVSFACAMQVQTFRKVNGYAFSSTMCIGNIRSGMASLCGYLRAHDKAALKKALCYWVIILLFAIGSGIGGCLVSQFGAHAVWGSCLLLLAGFCLMFIREDLHYLRES